MRGLIDYWGEKFDWRAQEDRLNAFPQYKVRLHDIDLHFLHVEEQGPERDWLFILAILRAHAQVVASSCECQDSQPRQAGAVPASLPSDYFLQTNQEWERFEIK